MDEFWHMLNSCVWEIQKEGKVLVVRGSVTAEVEMEG